jgi:hypothetical protein
MYRIFIKYQILNDVEPIDAPHLYSESYWKIVILSDLKEICIFIMKAIVYIHKIPNF